MFKKKCQVHLPFLKSSMHLCELSSTLEHPKGPQALCFAFTMKFNKPKDADTKL